MTVLFSFLAACIFALELYANVSNSQGIIAWIHLVVVGSLEIFLVGYLLLCFKTWILGLAHGGRTPVKKGPQRIQDDAGVPK